MSLSPDEWDPALRAVGAMAADAGRAPRAAALGENRLVVTGHPLSSIAALMALRAGGSAADAFVVATALDCVLVPGTSSLAGTLRLLVHDQEAAPPQTWALNAGLSVPVDELDEYDHARDGQTGRAVLVPGVVAGLDALWKRFGRLPWAELWEPAAYYAREGFLLDSSFMANMSRRQAVLLSRPEGRAIFAPAGRLPTHGSRFRQAALASTVAEIQAGRASAFYQGPWAEHLVEAVRALGGRIRTEDLATYEPIWQPSLTGSYLGFEIRTTQPPHNGGAHVLAALAVAEELELHGRPPRRDSGRTLYEEIRAITVALSESAFDLDPSDAGPQELDAYQHALTSIWAAARASEIRSASGAAVAPSPPLGSQNVIIRDDAGNVVVGIHTIHSDSWGDTGLFVDGVALNSSAHRLQLRRPRPGGRVTEPGSVFLALGEGRAVLASGAHNKAGPQAEFQNLINILGRGASLEESVNSRRFGFFAGEHPLPWRAEYALGRAVDVEDFPSATLQELADLGQPWRRREANAPLDVGFWYGIDLRRGQRSGVADPRRLGLALAE